MITEYLLIGVILIGFSVLQLWLNGLWPFRPQSGAKGAAAGARAGEGSGANGPARKRGDLWRSWTRIVGYAGIAMGVFVMVLGAVRA